MNFFLTAILAASAIAGSLLLSSCGSTPSGNTIRVAKTSGFNPNHGPFDSRGNYVEAWADAPPRRIYVTPKELKTKRTSTGIASTGIASSALIDEPIEPPIAYHAPKPAQVYRPKTQSPSRPKVTKRKPKPKQKAIVVKPKRKPPINYTVKKGDTLYGLAKRYKSGVKTIQIANSLKGTNIRIGQKLKIPRY